jgi:opacity protein-like surface antigen
VEISVSKAIFVSAFVIFALISGAMFAARTNPYSWQGPYLGINAGSQWSRLHNSSAKPSGIVGGVQAGYNVQFSQFVFGGETDLQWSSADDTFAPCRLGHRRGRRNCAGWELESRSRIPLRGGPGWKFL